MHRVAAGAALDEAGIPPAVVEQHRLPSLHQSFFQRIVQRAGKNAAVAADQLFAHIDDFDLGQRPARNALSHFQQHVLPVQRTGVGVNRWRGTAQHKAGMFQTAALPRHLPRVVTGMGIAAVGRFMLLIDQDQAKAAHRRKHRRASPDDHARLAPADAPPFVIFFTL